MDEPVKPLVPFGIPVDHTGEYRTVKVIDDETDELVEKRQWVTTGAFRFCTRGNLEPGEPQELFVMWFPVPN